MAIDRPQYIKLYEIAMEEVRHHHRLYTEIWLSAIFMTSVFFGGLYFLSSVPHLASTPLMFFMIIFGLVVIVVFYWATMRRGAIVSICRDIAKELEDILAGEIPEEAIETKPLLLTRAIEARQKKKLCFSWQVLWRWWSVFPVVLILFWIYLCVTVFITCG